jgi:Tol biopolymer transport system component/beta-lactamase regulating signal transducer with metallopeptidase domain
MADYPWAVALLVYLCGLGVFVLLMFVGLLRIGKYIRQGRILTEPRITEIFNAARRKLGHTRGCVVIETEAIPIPMTIRTFYPVVALPKDFTRELSDTEWRTVALHEVAHIKRNDPLVLSIVSVLRAVFFFHPLVWLAAREIFTLCEEVADDAVLETTSEPLGYAKMLTRLTETITRRMLSAELAVGIVFSKSVLLRRIESILSDRSEPLRRLSRWTLAMTLAVAFGSLFLAVAVPLTSPGSTTTPRHAAGMVQRHVWDVPPNSSLFGGISRDGRYLSYVDWIAGNLAVYDLTTKTNCQVTKNTDPTWKTSDGSNENSVVSPDGKQIAYSWLNHTDPEFYDLRIIDVDGTNMRVLYHDPNAVFFVMPHDFSPDGKEVLAYFGGADKSLVDEKTGRSISNRHLVLVSVADGSVRILKTWQRRAFPKRAFFSPDGHYVAYDFEHEDDLTLHDIFLMDLDGGGEISLIEHRANEHLCGWTPDGRRVVFASDRGSRRDLWMIEITGGVPQGEPRKLMGPFEGQPIGLTADGSLYYGVDTAASNVYLARLDSTGLNFEGEPELVSSQFVGSTIMADWSPDGSLLAYRVGSDVHSGRPLALCSVETSDEYLVSPAELFRPNSRMLGPWWSPDGESLLVCGESQQGRRGLYTVNVETGIPALISSIRDHPFLRHAVWSPDGKSIFARSPGSLSRLDLATGRETELYMGGGGLRGMDVSPDGRWLAFYRGKDSLVVMPSAGGEPREVVHLDEDEVNDTQRAFVRWTPDGEHLLFSKRESQMWKVHAESGVQQQIGPAIKGLVRADMHPDGRQIAFTVQQKGSALWVMENFLPD